jgi:hypothetical protein
MSTEILNALYNAPECDHETLLQALVAYFTDDIHDDDYYFRIEEMNELTNLAWAIEVEPHRF